MQRFANRAVLLPLPSPRGGRPSLAPWGLWAALASLAVVHGAGCVSTDRPTSGADTGAGPACEPNSTCDDGDPCTLGDVCQADGSCAGTPMPCDDTNPCTVDACALVGGLAKCVYAPQPGATCDDGDPCTTDDACGGDGKCAGTPKACDDDNPCTVDACALAGGQAQCVYTPQPGAPCDDGDPCTVADACDGGGTCAGVGKDCRNDSDLTCSTDSCDEATGQCQHDLAQCACVTAAQCDDDDPCTQDLCGADGACSNHVWSGDEAPACDDGDPCTTGDVCEGDGTCAGAAVDCDDGVACTEDACDAETGACSHDDAACECSVDSDCTTGDPCGEATCGTDHTCALSPALSDGAACTTSGGVSGACTEATCGGVVQVAAGFHHTCALTAAGGVRCWGFNNHGQVGSPANPDPNDGLMNAPDESASTISFDDSPDAHPVALALGEAFSCAVMSDGKVRCWGANDQGQLGANNTNDLLDQPNEAPSSLEFTAYSCEAKNENQQCTSWSAEVDPAQATNPDAIAAGKNFACVLGESKHVHCWGANDAGQALVGGLGYLANEGGVDFFPHPTPIMDEPDEKATDFELTYSYPDMLLGTAMTPIKIVAGRAHACVLGALGFASCWGANDHGQLGQGDQTTIGDNLSDSPKLVSFWPDHIVDIAAGGDHTCAALASGLVRCWGRNGQGQLGAGHTHDLMDEPGESPSVVTFLPRRAVKVACGGAHSCALLDDGTVHCWGQGKYGRLGSGSSEDLMDQSGETPSEVVFKAPVTDAPVAAIAIVAGQTHTCALLATHQVVCWGRGLNGRLGIGSTALVGDTPKSMPPSGYSNAMGAAGSYCYDGGQCLSGNCTNARCK